jgi:hypothetical protein
LFALRGISSADFSRLVALVIEDPRIYIIMATKFADLAKGPKGKQD